MKLAGLALLLSPMKSAWGNQLPTVKDLQTAEPNLLVINKRKKIAQFTGQKYFATEIEISPKNRDVVPFSAWETKIKTPIHFRKDRSGRIIEVLALQKLESGINDKTLNDVVNTISIAFSPIYNDKNGVSHNKFNYRLHELLLNALALNTSITAANRWPRFKQATGQIDYSALKNYEKLSKRMNWMTSKAKFDLQVFHIVGKKANYMTRLKERVADNKI